MDREHIEEVICDIMEHDGPDGHVDGYEILADFVLSVREGYGIEWYQKYLEERMV